jgi:hypothetical protein
VEATTAPLPDQPALAADEPKVAAPPAGRQEDPLDFELLHFRGSYLLWWVSRDNARLPVLTTGGAGRGILGQPDTQVLLRAGDSGEAGPISGGDFGVHCWLDAEQWLGLDVRFFFLGERSGKSVFTGNAAGSPLLSIPFNDLNAALPGPSFTQVASPGAVTGQVVFDNSTRLWGLEAGADLPSFAWGRLELSALVGFRYADLAERYSLVQNVSTVGQQRLLSFQGVPVPGSDSLQISDSFIAHNQFYGGNFVVRAELQLTPALSLGVTSKTALGVTQQALNVNGSTALLAPTAGQLAAVATAPGGLFAQLNNIGRRTDSNFSVIPELEARLGWALTPWAELTTGFNFLYWSNVLRPTRQVPDTINTTTAPSQATFGAGGPVPPTPAFRLSDLKAYGVSLGMVLRF